MSIQEMYDAALRLLEEHNEAIAPGKTGQPGQINAEEVITCIKTAGGTSLERLKNFSHEDIIQCLPAPRGVKPVALAKDLAKIFRKGVTEENNSDVAPYVSGKKAKKMSVKMLIINFDSDDPTSSVGKRLQEISRGEPFIIYEDETNRVIDVDLSVKHLQQIKKGTKGLETYKVGKEIKKVYRVGEIPNNFTDENPIYIGRPLLLDGICDQTNRSWEGVPKKVRQLVRIIIEKEYNGSVDIDAAHNLIDRAVASDAFEHLSDRYRNCSANFNQMSIKGSLPTLKILIGQMEKPKKSKNPFDNGSKVDMSYRPKYVKQKWVAPEGFLRANRNK